MPLNAILEPLSSSSFRVIKPAISESVKSESFKFLTTSLNVIVILELVTTFVSKSAGLNTYVGAALSIIVNVVDVALIALSNESSTVAPMAA